MTKNERRVVVLILLAIAVLASFDLFTDSKEGVTIWHILVEGGIALFAIAGVFYFLKGSIDLQHKLTESIVENDKLKKEAHDWKIEADKYIEGLSKSIDLQLSKWHLSNAEKEIALLLLKGLSLKEIAEIRGTTEKTARVQSISIYSKSGLAGRSELAAFFLEDLLQPQIINSNQENISL